jgi:uncharacterized protein YndB with AHSA1/START domain
MNTQTTMPPLRKTVTVEQPVDKAFALFTGRIAEWWPPADHPVAAGVGTDPGTVVLEPRPQGRIYHRRSDGTITTWGEVQVWEPPHRLVLRWQPAGVTGAPTEVEIRFTPEDGHTRVELEHRGWDQLGDRTGATRADYDSGWENVLQLYTAAGQDNNPAIASLILGIASVVLPVLGLLAAPFAIIFGIRGRQRARNGARQGGLATTGLTLGAIGLVLWGLFALLGVGLVVQSPSGEEEQVPVETIDPGP